MTLVQFVGGPVDGKLMNLLGRPVTYMVPVINGDKVRNHYYKRTETVVNGAILYKWKGCS